MRKLLVIYFVTLIVYNTLGATITSYVGLCDASAAIKIDKDRLLIATDEENIIRLYKIGYPYPIQEYNLDSWIKLDYKNPEADIEGAACIEGFVFWIGSHGRNKEGKLRLNRHSFFATKLIESETGISLLPIGNVRRDLLDYLRPIEAIYKFKLDNGMPPKQGGVNIEGLAADNAGHLWVGFRSPLVRAQALIVRIDNPKEVCIDQAPFNIGRVELINLEGLGIRDLVHIKDELYFVLAGAVGDSDKFSLYVVDFSTKVAKLCKFYESWPRDFRPEALVIKNMQDNIFDLWLVSDDGNRKIDGVTCKELDNLQKRQFRILECQTIIPSF